MERWIGNGEEEAKRDVPIKVGGKSCRCLSCAKYGLIKGSREGSVSRAGM